MARATTSSTKTATGARGRKTASPRRPAHEARGPGEPGRTSAADGDDRGTAAAWIPPRPSLPKLRAAAAGCQACHLWTVGTQTVFGEGPRKAELLVVGEQPGDQEDQAGHPFVGPAGRLLDTLLEAAGIDRSATYLTNVVKHFKWERSARSSRRVHKTPNAAEVAACYPWLAAEIRVVKPRVLLALGATAAQALLGKRFRVTADRGRRIESPHAEAVFATVHPSSILRTPDPASRARAENELLADLKTVVAYLAR